MGLFDQNRLAVIHAVERVWREIARNSELGMKDAEVTIKIEVTPTSPKRHKTKRKEEITLKFGSYMSDRRNGLVRCVNGSTVLDVHADKPSKVRVRNDGTPIWHRIMKDDEG